MLAEGVSTWRGLVLWRTTSVECSMCIVQPPRPVHGFCVRVRGMALQNRPDALFEAPMPVEIERMMPHFIIQLHGEVCRTCRRRASSRSFVVSVPSRAAAAIRRIATVSL